MFNTPTSHQGTITGVINNSTSTTTDGLTNHTDSSSIHQLQTSSAHPVTATPPGTATQISQQQQQLNACEVVDSNKSRQILINHRNDANVGVVSENYLHLPQQQQVKVSHHHETKSEIRLEKETSGANLTTTNAVSLPAGRKASIGDENGMITIVTINNNCNNLSESDRFGDIV